MVSGKLKRDGLVREEESEEVKREIKKVMGWERGCSRVGEGFFWFCMERINTWAKVLFLTSHFKLTVVARYALSL